MHAKHVYEYLEHRGLTSSFLIVDGSLTISTVFIRTNLTLQVQVRTTALLNSNPYYLPY